MYVMKKEILLGGRSEYFESGHRSLTCLKRGDDKVMCILRGSDEIIGDKLSQSINTLKRYVGLHIKSVIYQLENEENCYFRKLKNFKEDHSTAKHCNLFAGNIVELNPSVQFGALSCYKIYHALQGYSPLTGTHELAAYLINEAIFADIVSLFYKIPQNDDFNLSSLELKIIVGRVRLDLINLLDKMSCCSHSSDDEVPQRMDLLFGEYCALINQCLQHHKDEKLKESSLLIN